jgi:MFS family permease
MSEATGWSRAGISFGMTINFIVMAFGSFGWGAASDRWGARVVTLCGAVLLGTALTLASRANSLLAFQLTYGVLVGLAASAFFAPMIATVTGWFETRRNLAVSLVSAGMGMAPLTISPFATWLITHHGWRSAMFQIGVLAWVLLLPAACFVRRPPGAASANAAASSAVINKPDIGKALTSPQFLVLGFTFMLCCMAHSGPIFHVVSYAMYCGIGAMAAVSVYSVEGLAGLFGRILIGLLADRFGAKRILITMLAAQALAIAAYLKVNELNEFYTLDGSLASTEPHAAVCLWARLLPQTSGRSSGDHAVEPRHGVGPVAGGWVFDTFHNHAWLYIASSAVAVAP